MQPIGNTVQIVHHLAPGEEPDPITMLAEALVVWDETDHRGMDTERFMLAYLSEWTDPEDPGERQLALTALGPLMPVAQQSPAGFLRALGDVPVEGLRAMFCRPDDGNRKVAGLACFVHLWALVGQATEDYKAGLYTGNPLDHPDRVRLRLMAAHYGGHTLTMARAADGDLPLPYPPEQFGPLLPALVGAAEALAASRQGEPA